MVRKTKAEAEATRQAILDAAELVFMECGVNKSSLEQIACRAGVTRGAVYWHFRNKQDLFDALLERVRAPLTERLAEGEQSEDIIENLRQVCICCLRQLVEDEHYLRAYTILFHRTESSEAIQKHNTFNRETAALLNRQLSKPAARQRLRAGISPEHAVRQLQAQVTGIFFNWLADQENWCLREQAEPFIDVIFHGLFEPAPAE